MKLRKISIVLLFRGLWIILAMALMLFVISRNIYTGRFLTYKIDFKDNSTPNYRGWYPNTRTSYDFNDQKLYIQGEPVYLKDIWPSQEEVAEEIEGALDPEIYTRQYADVYTGNEQWNEVDVPSGALYEWDPDSTYIQR